MGTDPEALNAIVNIVAKRSIVTTNSDGPQWPDPFEM